MGKGYTGRSKEEAAFDKFTKNVKVDQFEEVEDNLTFLQREKIRISKHNSENPEPLTSRDIERIKRDNTTRFTNKV